MEAVAERNAIAMHDIDGAWEVWIEGGAKVATLHFDGGIVSAEAGGDPIGHCVLLDDALQIHYGTPAALAKLRLQCTWSEGLVHINGHLFRGEGRTMIQDRVVLTRVGPVMARFSPNEPATLMHFPGDLLEGPSGSVLATKTLKIGTVAECVEVFRAQSLAVRNRCMLLADSCKGVSGIKIGGAID